MYIYIFTTVIEIAVALIGVLPIVMAVLSTSWCSSCSLKCSNCNTSELNKFEVTLTSLLRWWFVHFRRGGRHYWRVGMSSKSSTGTIKKNVSKQSIRVLQINSERPKWFLRPAWGDHDLLDCCNEPPLRRPRVTFPEMIDCTSLSLSLASCLDERFVSNATKQGPA